MMSSVTTCDGPWVSVESELYFDGSCLSPSAAQECGIHSKQECYPLAFGVPAALMVIALGTKAQYTHQKYANV